MPRKVRKLGQLKEPAKLRAWLCGIARNLVNGAVRRDAREPVTVAEPMDCIDEPPAAGPRPADHAISQALVSEDTVFFGDTGGRFYALDRKTGAERWKLNARAEGFPGAHPINVFMASPILADGKLIVAGGTLEQVFSAFPGYKGCTGRGFVLALDPKTAESCGSTTSVPSPSRSILRSPSRTVGAIMSSTLDPRRAAFGALPLTTRNPEQFSSARMSTRRRAGRPRTIPGSTPASRARSSPSIFGTAPRSGSHRSAPETSGTMACGLATRRKDVTRCRARSEVTGAVAAVAGPWKGGFCGTLQCRSAGQDSSDLYQALRVEHPGILTDPTSY